MILFCFTYAGGTAAFYNELNKFISSDIKVVALEYPGHGSRRRQEFCCNVFDLADDMISIMSDYIIGGEPYALLGYSMGSIVATCVLEQLIKQRSQPPMHVFLAAHEPMIKDELRNYSEDEADEIIKKRVISFNGVPKNLQSNPVFWRMYFPLYKADFALIGRFDFDSINFITQIPATVFYSESDTKIRDMVKWKKYFVGVCDFLEYSGNHFFIREHVREMAEQINLRLGMEGNRQNEF